MSAQKFANFPERDFKVVIGQHINAQTTRTLGRLSIGTFEMTVNQQEKVQQSAENARLTLGTWAKEQGLEFRSEQSRDYVCHYVLENASAQYQIWFTPPFEGAQTSHLLWCKYVDRTAERRIGVSFRLATSFTGDEVVNTLKQAQKNAVDLPANEPYVLSGNPPPRFQKKAKPAEAAPAEGEKAPAAEDKPAG